MIDTLEIESDNISAEIQVEFHHVDASFDHLFGIKYEYYYELDGYDILSFEKWDEDGEEIVSRKPSEVDKNLIEQLVNIEFDRKFN